MEEQRKQKRHGRTRKIVLGVIALVVLVSGALAWRFRDEIKALGVSRQYSSKELEDKLLENDQKITDAASGTPELQVRAPTKEESKALQDGSLSCGELKDRLTEKADAVPASAASGKPETPAASGTTEAPAAPKSDYSEQLSQLIAEVYVLKETYTAALSDLEAAAKADYKALPESKRTAAGLASLASRYLGVVNRMEKECDEQMHEIITEMEELIAANNGDTSLPGTVFDTYVNEKSLKKACYLSRLQEKGLT